MDSIKYWQDHNLTNYLRNNTLDSKEINLILNWLQLDSSTKYHRQIHKLSVPDALALSYKNIKKTEDFNLEKKEKIQKVKDYKNGWTWVILKNDSAYKRDSILLQSCLEEYATKDTQIYSLRYMNKAQINVEFDPSQNKITQIEGFRNLDIKKEYLPFIQDLIFNSGLISHDLEIVEKYLLKIGKGRNINNEIFDWSNPPTRIEHQGTLILKRVPSNPTMAKTLVVHGDLYFSNNANIKIANELIVSGSIFVMDCFQLKMIADNLTCKDLDIVRCPNLLNKV